MPLLAKIIPSPATTVNEFNPIIRSGETKPAGPKPSPNHDIWVGSKGDVKVKTLGCSEADHITLSRRDIEVLLDAGRYHAQSRALNLKRIQRKICSYAMLSEWHQLTTQTEWFSSDDLQFIFQELSKSGSCILVFDFS